MRQKITKSFFPDSKSIGNDLADFSNKQILEAPPPPQTWEHGLERGGGMRIRGIDKGEPNSDPKVSHCSQADVLGIDPYIVLLIFSWGQE